MEGTDNKKGKSGNADEAGPYGIPAALADSPGFLLNRSARLIRDRNTEALKPTGLTVRDLGLLRVIASEGPLTQQALSERHKTDRSTIVDVIDGLEKRQLVVRCANPRDRRSYLLMITPRGKKLLGAANKLTLKEKQKFLEALNDDEWHVLRELLARLIDFHDRPESKSESKPEIKPEGKPESKPERKSQ
jgi:MarR family transcriptional regulator, lower aerobic nicotinate degradation pathway regulator